MKLKSHSILDNRDLRSRQAGGSAHGKDWNHSAVRMATARSARSLMAFLCLGSGIHSWPDPAPATAGHPSTELHETVNAPRPELDLPASPEFDFVPPEPGSYRLPVIKQAGDGEVLYTTGHSCSLRELMRDRITVLSFIYLRCASGNACPRATGMLHQLHQINQQDPVLRENLRLISMSFDPAHDTPQKMANYGKAFRRDTPSSEWLFLTTRSQQELSPILQAYDQSVDPRGNSRDPLGPYYHPVRVYLIDRRGQIRNIYSFATLDPRLILTDARTLLLEESSPTPNQPKK